jgi:hypothetical protein
VPLGAAEKPVPPTPPPFTEPRSTWSEPPQPERRGGPLERLKSRQGGIAAGVAVAVVLLMIMRRLR